MGSGFMAYKPLLLIECQILYVSSTDRLFRCITTLQCGETRETLQAGVVVIVVGNGHGDTSSNPERDWLHFT